MFSRFLKILEAVVRWLEFFKTLKASAKFLKFMLIQAAVKLMNVAQDIFIRKHFSMVTNLAVTNKI